MPYWWTTAHLQAQCAMDVYCPTDISLNRVKSMTVPKDCLRYCPPWVAAKKKGRPKADNRKKSVVDHILESALKKQGRRTKLYCRICNMADFFRTLQINRVHWRRRRMSLARTVRKARFERLLKVHRGTLVSSMGSGFYGGDIFMVKY